MNFYDQSSVVTIVGAKCVMQNNDDVDLYRCTIKCSSKA